MTQESPAIAAIDVGTTKVCTVVGRKDDSGGVQVLGYSAVPCSGLRKGTVFNPDATEKSIRESVQEVQGKTGVTITSAFVGVTGSHVGYVNRRDRLDPPETQHNVLTSDALEENPKGLVGAANSPGRQMIHAVKMSYSVDGHEELLNPLGMHSANVHVDSHVLTGDSTFIEKLEQSVMGAGVHVQQLVFEPLASGLSVLTAKEKERGALLIDIGGGTTDLVAFRRGRIHFSKVIPIGGWQFTNDIVVAFNTSFEAAEEAKLEHGTADLQGIQYEEQLSLPVVDRDMELQVPRMELCQLLRERAQELARLVAISLDDAGVDLGDQPTIVLTGGASRMPGLADVLERNLGIPAREGAPSPKGGDPQESEELTDPAYATAIGILTWAATEYPHSSNGSKTGHSNGFKNTVESEPRGGLFGPVRVLFSRRNGKGRN